LLWYQVVVVVVVVAVVTLGQWDPHRCNKMATVSHQLELGKLAGKHNSGREAQLVTMSRTFEAAPSEGAICQLAARLNNQHCKGSGTP
jgi:hypothetical protein